MLRVALGSLIVVLAATAKASADIGYYVGDRDFAPAFSFCTIVGLLFAAAAFFAGRWFRKATSSAIKCLAGFVCVVSAALTVLLVLYIATFFRWTARPSRFVQPALKEVRSEESPASPSANQSDR